MAEWFSMESIRKINPFHMPAFQRYTCVEVKKRFGLRLDGACSFHSKNVEILFNKKQFNSAGKKLLEKVINDPKLVSDENKKLVKYAKKYRKTADKILKTDLRKISDSQLALFAEEYAENYLNSHKNGGHMLQLTEFENEFYSKFIQSILGKKIRRYNLNESLAEAFTLASTPEKLTNIQKQEIELLELYLELLKKPELLNLFRKKSVKEIEEKLSKVSPAFSKKLSNHHSKWLWLPFMYEGPAWEKTYFIEVLSSMARQYLTKEEAELKKSEPKNMIKKAVAFRKKLPLDNKEKMFFKILFESVYLKSFRKDIMYFGCYTAEKLFSEIGKRLGLSLNQVRNFMPEEIKQAVLHKKFSVKELNDRLDFTVIKWINSKEEVLSGKKARNFFNKVFKSMKIKKVSRLKGSTAVPGFVKGKVKIVNHPNEIYKMNQGDVMVSHSTNPNLVPAMKKAGAIITDVGGVTCHAAIVSRELNIPCVIGTKQATRILKDGETVEVDASRGIIKRLKK
ncbi:MAG: PEP-utilizing enzyme [archaeon]